MKNKLLLINAVDSGKPEWEGMGITKINGYEPVALGIIAALTPKRWEIEIIDENIKDFKYTEANLVGISSYTASINKAYKIAELYRNNNIPVIIGGVHATLFPEEVSKYSDVTVVGEAEFVWHRIISDFETGNLKKIYESPASDSFPEVMPDRPSYNHAYDIATIQVSRGCPNSCNYCNVPVINRFYYKFKDINAVIAELKSLKQDYVVFVDDNLIGYSNKHLDFVKKLFNTIIEERIAKEWMCFTTINIAENEEILKLMSRSGCRLVYVGIESETLRGLQDLNKKKNYSYAEDQYKSLLKTFHKYNIAVAGGFMCGMDSDDMNSFAERKNFILKSSIDGFTYTYCTPLPKTKLFHSLESEKRLFNLDFPKDWKKFNLGNITFSPVNHLPELFYKEYYRQAFSIHKIRVFVIKFFRTFFNTNLRTAVATFIFLRHNHVFLNNSMILKTIERMYRMLWRLN